MDLFIVLEIFLILFVRNLTLETEANRFDDYASKGKAVGCIMSCHENSALMDRIIFQHHPLWSSDSALTTFNCTDFVACTEKKAVAGGCFLIISLNVQVLLSGDLLRGPLAPTKLTLDLKL